MRASARTKAGHGESDVSGARADRHAGAGTGAADHIGQLSCEDAIQTLRGAEDIDILSLTGRQNA